MHHPNKRGLRNQSAISKVHWRGVRSFARYELKGNPKEMLHRFQSAALVVPSHPYAKHTLAYARWKHHANRSMQSAGWRWCFPDEGASHLVL